jgi:hypothetical protein
MVLVGGRTMGKYESLTAFLQGRNLGEIRMTFKEIEKLIGAPLPASARRHRAWWSNNRSNSVITYAWLEAGYRSGQVDMKGQRVVFQRETAPAEKTIPNESAETGLPPFFGTMKGLMKIAPGTDLTAPADPDWEA